MKKSNKWKSVIDLGSEKKEEFEGGYTIAFVYSCKGNFLVKGFFSRVKKYIRRVFKKNYFVNYSIWRNGSFRNCWLFWKENVYIHSPSVEKRKWVITNFCEKTIKFKRIPKRWIKELEKF